MKRNIREAIRLHGDFQITHSTQHRSGLTIDARAFDRSTVRCRSSLADLGVHFDIATDLKMGFQKSTGLFEEEKEKN